MQQERHLAIEFIVMMMEVMVTELEMMVMMMIDGDDGDRVGESNEDGVLVAISLKPAEEQKCSNG